MSVEQSMDHRRDVLGAVRRPFDRCQLGGVAGVADGDPAKALDPLGQEVDELELLPGVLIEEQMQLVERRAGDELVMLLVERVEDHRVVQDLIEDLAAPHARLGREGDRQETQRAEPLDLRARRGEARLRREASTSGAVSMAVAISRLRPVRHTTLLPLAASMELALPVTGHSTGWAGHRLVERVIMRRGQDRSFEILLGGVIPIPVLVRLEALDDRMADGVRVVIGMLGRRRIAAAHVTAPRAAAQVKPPATRVEALHAARAARRHRGIDHLVIRSLRLGHGELTIQV